MNARSRPLYARTLRLNHLRPGGLLCFLYFEGALGFATIAALGERISWWGVLVLPLAVAIMVKLNDLAAGARLAGTEPEPGPAGAHVANSEPARIVNSRHRRDATLLGRTYGGAPEPALAVGAMRGERRAHVRRGGINERGFGRPR